MRWQIPIARGNNYTDLNYSLCCTLPTTNPSPPSKKSSIQLRSRHCTTHLTIPRSRSLGLDRSNFDLRLLNGVDRSCSFGSRKKGHWIANHRPVRSPTRTMSTTYRMCTAQLPSLRSIPSDPTRRKVRVNLAARRRRERRTSQRLGGGGSSPAFRTNNVEGLSDQSLRWSYGANVCERARLGWVLGCRWAMVDRWITDEQCSRFLCTACSSRFVSLQCREVLNVANCVAASAVAPSLVSRCRCRRV